MLDKFAAEVLGAIAGSLDDIEQGRGGARAIRVEISGKEILIAVLDITKKNNKWEKEIEH